GCSVSHPPPPASTPSPSPGARSSIGTASWYGQEFDGRRTASGAVFDQDGLSAAHRSLPLGTRVRVTNLANGRSVALRITDRGPFVKGRALDLSYGAARRLHMVHQGTGKVRIEVLERPSSRPATPRRRVHRRRVSR